MRLGVLEDQKRKLKSYLMQEFVLPSKFPAFSGPASNEQSQRAFEVEQHDLSLMLQKISLYGCSELECKKFCTYGFICFGHPQSGTALEPRRQEKLISD